MSFLVIKYASCGTGVQISHSPVDNPVSRLFNTDKVAKAKRFESWRDMLCGVHAPLDCQRLSPRSFRASAEFAQFDQVGLSRVRSVEQKMVWMPTRFSTNEGVLLVTLQTIGVGLLLQDGTEAQLEPGCISFHESVRPFTWIFPGEFEQLVIRLPRETLGGKWGAARWTARIINGGSAIGSLVSGFLRHAFTVVGDCSPSTAYRISQIARDLIATALSELTGEEPPANAGRVALLLRAKQVIESNLHDPELSPAKVAGMSRISLRYLQDLFNNENTSPSAWIWQRRLARCHSMLMDPSFVGTSISDIAFNCGFSDYSHFNHRFKAAFSLSPSEYRNLNIKPAPQTAR